MGTKGATVVTTLGGVHLTGVRAMAGVTPTGGFAQPVDEAHACLVADMLLKARRGAGVEPDHEVVGVDERAQLIEQRAAAVADHCTGARASWGRGFVRGSMGWLRWRQR